MKRPARVILAWPLAFALASLTGLVLGLVGDGAPDFLSWLLLGAGPVAIAAVWLRRTKPFTSRSGTTDR